MLFNLFSAMDDGVFLILNLPRYLSDICLSESKYLSQKSSYVLNITSQTLWVKFVLWLTLQTLKNLVNF